VKIVKRAASLLALILVAGFLMTGRPIAAQSKAESSSPSNSKRVEVGDAKVTGSHLKAYTNLWKFTQQKTGGVAEPAGTWSDSLESVDFRGRPALKRTQIAKWINRGLAWMSLHFCVARKRRCIRHGPRHWR
jgi:hypothetical protein